MNIDWDNAPDGATHWCGNANKFITADETCEKCIPRPTRTKEQRERDELIEIILTDGDLSAGMLADVIINAGYRKPED